MKIICVVTSTRADYGILKPMIFRLHDDSELELRIAVTGSHLAESYGMTVHEIEGDGLPVHCHIPILADDNMPDAVSRTMASALTGFAAYFTKHRPDMLVVLGDRYEIAAICCAAVNARIPIAHVHGGETTEGAIDEAYRHSITKMSYLHFAACEAYRKRIIQLGEAPERVFNVGALGIENALATPRLSQDELCEQVGFDFTKPYAVVTFHPVTLENGTEEKQCNELFAALDEFPKLGLLITKSNADAGGQLINDAIDVYAAHRDNCTAVYSLGARRYLSAIHYSEFVIGNSSSGIVEVPVFRVPTVNIGDRQKGRLRADSVIDCAPDKVNIVSAIDKAMSDEFREKAKHTISPYGTGETSAKIVSVIKDYLYHDKINLKKSFYDITFEVGE